jgi:hypothetical protein
MRAAFAELRHIEFVGAFAQRRRAAFALEAMAAGDGPVQQHGLAELETFHVGADGLDVAGGFDEMSYTTRLTPGVMR